MIAIELTEEVDTLGGLLPRGRQLFAVGEDLDVVSLVDSRGVQWVSCCPRGKFQLVSESIPDRLYDYFDGVRRPESGVSHRPAAAPEAWHDPQVTEAGRSIDPVNAELAGLRTRASVESCPFEELPASTHPRAAWEPPQPLTVVEYTTPDRLAMSTAKRFQHRASDHPRRGEWEAEWTISGYGFESGARVIYSADCTTDRDETGKTWRHFVDLERGNKGIRNLYRSFFLHSDWKRFLTPLFCSPP